MKRNEQLVQLAGNEKNTDLLPSAGEHERANLKDTSIMEPFNIKSDGSSANPSEIKISSKDASQYENQFGIEKLKNLSLQNTRDSLLNVKGARKDGGKENEISLPSVKDMKLYENWTNEAAKKIPCVLKSKNRIESATSLDSISESESSKECEDIKLVLPFLLPKRDREGSPYNFLDWVTHKLGGRGPNPTEDNDSRKESDPKVVSKDSSPFAKENEGGKEETPLSSADYKKLYEEWILEIKNAFPVPKPLESLSLEGIRLEDDAQILVGENSTPSEVTATKNEPDTKVKEPQDSKTSEKSEEI